jgi:hypothetical protein
MPYVLYFHQIYFHLIVITECHVIDMKLDVKT